MKNREENVNINEKQKLLQSQDMKIIKALAGNDKKIRDRALKNLKEWFLTRSSQIPFTHDDFIRIWKGLFTSMWMSDKPLIQEECAENISHLIHHVDSDSALMFFKCGLTVMSLEWFGIDQWRLDKFLMLIRRMLRQCFEFLKIKKWSLKLIVEFNKIITETVIRTDNFKFLGLTMHVTEIFLEELAKVSIGKIDQKVLLEFLKPFIKQLSSLDDHRQIKHITKHVFHHLMQQSNEGLEHESKFKAWKRLGFPGGSIDVMEKVDVDSDEDEDVDADLEVLDPRAGQVDVILPQLKFNPSDIGLLLKQVKFTKQSTTNGKNAITKLQREFAQMTEGVYPLGVTEIPVPEIDDSLEIDKSLSRLQSFERKLRAEKRKLNSNEDGVGIFASKLQGFIEKSEGKIKKKKLMKKQKPFENDLDWSYENAFERNSGLWKVYRLNSSITESPAKVINTKITKTRALVDSIMESPAKVINTRITKTRALVDSITESPAKVINTKIAKTPALVNGESHKKLRKTPVKQEPKTLFQSPQNKKSKIRSKSLPGSKNSNCKTPTFAVHRKIPKSEKKVRIALKLNQSQEIHEHVAQLKSSPGIPYDANKRPEKPLLKPNTIKSPINPFYKKKFKL